MKGEQTRIHILGEAIKLASLEGLEALSIGRLAKAAGLSKSGLFAHFKSKEALQVQVLERAAEDFVGAVIRPALKNPRGLPRLDGLFENWLRWAMSHARPGGCVFLAAAMEFDDRPGTQRNYLMNNQKEWVATLEKAARLAQEEGHLQAELDTQQLAFEIYGLMMSFHVYQRLLGDSGAQDRAMTGYYRLTGRTIGANNS